MKIALISCSKQKQTRPCMAKEMYHPSELFRLSYQYAQQHADQIYILSAKYGLLHDEDLINPYNLALSDLPPNRQEDWANYVLSKMRNLFDLENDSFIILAGRDYYRHLITALEHYTLPLGNRRIGERISFLEHCLSAQGSSRNLGHDTCLSLHHLFQPAPRYTFDQIKQITFENGIYVMFESGQTYAGMDRIVRIGTHRAPNRLKNRLQDHFIVENKDGSIFRKNIGRTLLSLESDPYLAVWNLDTSKQANWQYVLPKKHSEIEHRVSEYLRSHITFTVFEEADATIRLRLETGIIASLNQADDFGPDKTWLGNHSPEVEIRTSGLWLKQGLDGEPLNQNELKYIIDRVQQSRGTLGQHKKREHVQEQYAIPESSPAIKTGIADIKAYIHTVLSAEKDKGSIECVLISGDIHRRMQLSNKMPSVCSAMYALMRPDDEVLHTTPSGKSSTIKIKYHLI